MKNTIIEGQITYNPADYSSLSLEEKNNLIYKNSIILPKNKDVKRISIEILLLDAELRNTNPNFSINSYPLASNIGNKTPACLSIQQLENNLYHIEKDYKIYCNIDWDFQIDKIGFEITAISSPITFKYIIFNKD